MQEANNPSASPLPTGGSEETPQPQVPPSHGRKIFIGPQGLRPGWRFLSYLVLATLCFFAFSFVVLWLVAPRRPGFDAWTALAQEVAMFLAALAPALILGKFEEHPLAEYGLPAPGIFGRNFWEGMLWGIVSVSLLMAALHGASAFDYGKVVLHGYYLVKWGVFWGVFFLFVGLFEEFTFRGYTLATLTEGVGFWPAALFLSFLFGAIHMGNPGEAWVGGLAAALIGLWLALTVRRTGTLWLAIGFHLAFDWGETFLYSVPDSGTLMPGHLLSSHFHGPRWLTGGSVGPEGSVLIFGLIGLLFVVFDRVHRQAKYPPAVRSAALTPQSGD
ncbi:MAG TPA: type II CAAX endopeptidase family protein [Terriglobales bacterium]|jgi:membrane protease YdiL (CAAX protease family)|nr:type II CAAX endopeptidase family protein [Terriglobales bacterium]